MTEFHGTTEYPFQRTIPRSTRSKAHGLSSDGKVLCNPGLEVAWMPNTKLRDGDCTRCVSKARTLLGYPEKK